MSDPKDPMSFQELEDDDLDVAAIFGSDTAPADPIPFQEVQSDPKAESGDKSQFKPEPPAGEKPAAPQSVKQSTGATDKTTEPKAESVEDLFAAFGDGGVVDPPPVPLGASKPAPVAGKQVSLFDKPPVFKYGGAQEKIEDTSMTFEELRIKKADDFPELEEGKKVSWSVKYGNENKPVPDPKGTTIAKMKEDIETSKSFLDALKKGKIKDPECLLIPTVRAQSKGIASAYKGVFPTADAARNSDKVICLIPARDGKIMEMRKTEMGEVIVPKRNIVDFEELRAGFTPALPLIPRALMGQIIAFFRSFMKAGAEYEALVNIYWDRDAGEYLAFVPKQRATKASVNTLPDSERPAEERYYHYADIHSHNSMAARFSSIDDADEKATRLYMVVGHLDKFYPEISARISCGGTFLEIDPRTVVESVEDEFPIEWLDQVEQEDLSEQGHAAARPWEDMFPDWGNSR